MFQKENIPFSFREKYINIRYAFKALNDTFLFLML